MIQVEGLKAGYPTGFTRRWREVLRGVTFKVPPGSVTGYLGLNGAGKTTTIKILVGINAPAAGTVLVAGLPAASAAAKASLGYFPEAPFFYEGLTALELLEFFGRLSGTPRAERLARSRVLLEEVGLGSAQDLCIREYSKGMRQRLGLAQALVHDPQLLILDEPLDGLDPMGRLQLRDLILRQRQEGKTVFFSSHVLGDVEAICDHLVILDGGRIAYEGTSQGLAPEEPQVHLRFSLPTESEAQANLAALACAPLQPGREGTWEVLCPGQAEADRTLQALLEAEGKLLSLIPRRPTLEETFRTRFGQGGPEGADA